MNFDINNIKTKSASAKLTATALAVSIAALSHSASAANSEILNLSANQVAPDTTELRFSFSGAPVTPKINPVSNKLLVDFRSVSTNLPQKEKALKVGAVNSSRFSAMDGNTRVMLSLNSDKHTTSYYVDGNDLVLVVKPAKANQAHVARAQKPSPANSSGEQFYGSDEGMDDVAYTAATPTARSNPLLTTYISEANQNYDGLSAVNFSGSGNDGNISISLTDESIPVDVQRQGNKIVVRMNGSTVPKHLIRKMSVNNGLVSSISASNKGRNGSVVINMSGDFEYQAYQSGNQLNITVSQPKLLTEPSLEERVYTGEPISLQFQKVEVRNILQMLADFTDMNIVASDSVGGNITLRLINVPWDQALDIILDSKNLDKRVNGNTITVAPAAELAKKEADALKAIQEKQNLQPLRTEYIRLSYSRVGDIMKLISEGRGSGSRGTNRDNGSLLSDRGTVSSDERTNTLIVKDTSQSIENIRALISKVDIPVKQVMVEARIVSASDNFSKELGVKWGILSNGAANNDSLLVGASDETLWNLKEFDVSSTTINGKTVNYPTYDISRPDNLNVDLGVSGAAGRIAFGLLSMSDMMLDLELSAMQADSRGEVISTPKVLTADKQTAKVISGTQLPYLEAAASGATSVSFVEAALSLEVTPNITPEGKIGLQLNISNDSPTQLQTGQYAIDTNQISTNVVVEDGQTVVLGGVFKNNVSNGQTKVPFLGDLPYVGKLFRNDIQSNKKEELLIFVTPKLVHDGSTSF